MRWIEDEGHRLLVVSAGFRTLIDPVLAAAGLSHLHVHAGDALFTLEGTCIAFPPSRMPCVTECAHCKSETIAAHGPFAGPVVYIGDGFSDRCASRVADVVFARRELARHLDDEGVAYHPFEDFYQVMEILARPAIAVHGVVDAMTMRGGAPPSLLARHPDEVVARASSSAICTALSAAPLRTLSATTHRLRPCATVGSRRMRPTYTGSVPDGRDGHGVDEVRGVVAHLDAGGGSQEFSGALRAQVAVELHVHRLGMPVVDRHPHAGGRHRDGGVAHDLLGLVHHLLLFLGGAVVAGTRRSGAGS